MRTSASHATAAPGRLSQRAGLDEVLRPYTAGAPVAASPRAHAPRFDIVRGDRDAQPPVRSAHTMVPGQQASWSPVHASAQGAAVEQYRRLAGSLIRAREEHGARVFMVTSSVSGEGKSLTTANLAVTLAHSYRRETLVIDADQRDPTQHQVFNVGNRVGLSDYLSGAQEAPAVMMELLPGLALMPAGRPTSDPMGGLTSRRMRDLLTDAADSFDFVFVDSPPVTLVPDAGLLAPIVDAVVLVIGAASTQYDAIARAVAVVGRERILGTVLNRADPASFGRYGYGYGYPRA
jgi:capsular exopolysaccharide synthesis family protein